MIFRLPNALTFTLAILFVFSGLQASSTTAADSDWARFRGPSGDGVADASARPPLKWDASTNIAWRTELPGEGWSSPVIAGDSVYVTAAIPNEETEDSYDLVLLVLDRESGEVVRNVSVMPQTAESKQRTHKKNSHASPTPIVAGDRVFVHFGYQGTACVSTSGDVIWTNRELFFKPTHGNGGTPILVGNRLIFTCDGDKTPKIVGLDADTGQVAWQTARPNKAKKTFSFCTPTLITHNGIDQVIAPGSDCVLSLDPQTGRTIWDVRYVGYSVVPKPVYHDGRVFVATSFDNSIVLAIRPGGKGNVTETHVDWQIDKNMPKTPSMVVSDNLLYAVADSGVLACIAADSGEIVYRKRLGGNYSASPILAGGHLYFTSEDGLTTVIKSGRDYEQVATNDLDERALASPAAAGDSIYLRTADALYRIKQ